MNEEKSEILKKMLQTLGDVVELNEKVSKLKEEETKPKEEKQEAENVEYNYKLTLNISEDELKTLQNLRCELERLHNKELTTADAIFHLVEMFYDQME